MGEESLTLTTADDLQLQAERSVPDQPVGAVVLCHPHPLYGGSMHDGVPDALFRSLPRAGVAALRFNFRGVGSSQGAHDGGVAERLDVLAAIDALQQGLDAVGAGGPLVVAGWSFGGDVSLTAEHPAVAGWIPIAAPLRVVSADRFTAIAGDGRPKRLLVPEHDQYNPPAEAAVATQSWANTTLVTVPGGDHFLWGHSAFLHDAVVQFVGELAAAPA